MGKFAVRWLLQVVSERRYNAGPYWVNWRYKLYDFVHSEIIKWNDNQDGHLHNSNSEMSERFNLHQKETPKCGFSWE